jgi:predicted nucleic acid-binding protein
MGGPHKQQAKDFRVPPELKDAAQKALEGQPERDDPWTLNDIVIAALAEYVKRPRTREKRLEPFKPPRKRGRPRKER